MKMAHSYLHQIFVLVQLHLLLKEHQSDVNGIIETRLLMNII